jgi:hypothetical protein
MRVGSGERRLTDAAQSMQRGDCYATFEAIKRSLIDLYFDPITRPAISVIVFDFLQCLNKIYYYMTPFVSINAMLYKQYSVKRPIRSLKHAIVLGLIFVWQSANYDVRDNTSQGVASGRQKRPN